MARRRRRNNKKKNGSTISVAGINYVIKHLLGPVLKESPMGVPVAEFKNGNWAKGSRAYYNNVKNLGLGELIVDGVKIGLVRKVGLGVTVMKIGDLRIRSV